MELTATAVERLIDTRVRPRVRVDGGEVAFAGLEGDRVQLEMRNDCATCPACGDGLKWWIERELARAFGRNLTVVMHRKTPYYAL